MTYFTTFVVEKLKNSCSTETGNDDDMKASGSCGAHSSSESGIDMSLIEAVDTMTMLYFFGVHRQFSKVRHAPPELC